VSNRALHRVPRHIARGPLRESESLIVLNGRQDHGVHLVVAVVLGQQQHREARVARGQSKLGKVSTDCALIDRLRCHLPIRVGAVALNGQRHFAEALERCAVSARHEGEKFLLVLLAHATHHLP
jgi:hypothetical protein